MIARTHICLRCQLRLAKRPACRVRYQSTESKVSAHSPTALSRPSDDNKVFLYPPVRRPLRPRAPRNPQLEASGWNVQTGRLYGHSGQKLQDDRERLEIDALGQPADVIVLRDSKFNYYTHAKVLDSAEQEKVDILERLNSERGLIRQDEVEANVNEFRPKNGEELGTWEEFNGLVESLQKGFTTRQLELYIKNNSKATSASSGDVSADQATTALVRISPWFPQFAQTTKQFRDDSLRGYLLDSHTTKQRVVIRLLRECWKLSLPVLEEEIGQIEVHLRPRDLEFMLRGSNSLLKEISADHICEEQEKIEAFRSRSVIRITAPRFKAEAVVRDIEGTVQRIHRVEISRFELLDTTNEITLQNSKNLLDPQFEDTTFHELSRITDTDILKQSKHRVVISCIKDVDSKVSSPAELARNQFLAIIQPPDHVVYTLEIKRTGNHQGAFVKYPTTEGLSWHERLKHWSRWVMPLDKDIKDLTESPTLSRSHKVPGAAPRTKRLVQNLQRNAPIPSSKGSAYWSSPRNKSPSALIGSVLHSQANNVKPQSNTLDQKVLSEASKAFSTRVPNLTQFIASLGSTRWKPIETIVLRLLPNPFQLSNPGGKAVGVTAMSSFPPVEMVHHASTKDGKLRSTKIQAIFRERMDDVMLPDRAVDLRFTRRWTSRFYSQDDMNVRRFLNDSIFDLVSGQLATPATITLPISKHLCKGSGFQLLKNGISAVDENIVHVEYLVVAVESRKTFPLKFDGWDLLYTSIDGGKTNGRRSELKLLPASEGFGIAQSDFVAASYKLADAISSPESLSKARKVAVETPVSEDPTMAWKTRRSTDVNDDGKGVPAISSEKVLVKDDGSEDTKDEDFVDMSL